jgi:hypothetical protein
MKVGNGLVSHIVVPTNAAHFGHVIVDLSVRLGMESSSRRKVDGMGPAGLHPAQRFQPPQFSQRHRSAGGHKLLFPERAGPDDFDDSHTVFRAKPDRAAASRLYQNGRGAPWVCDRSFGRPWRLFGSASCPTTSGRPRAWVRKKYSERWRFRIPPRQIYQGSATPSVERRPDTDEPPKGLRASGSFQ